jgi:uroporphyrinogen-III decarboxylase
MCSMPGSFPILLSVTDREVLHRLCRRRLEIMLRTVRFLLDAGVGPFFSMLGQEYIVPPLHGPGDFRDFNVRYDRQIIDLIHESGGRVHVHSHGSIRKVFPDFVEMGTDVLHPFEAPPQGDIPPAEAKEMARGRMCLEGNIQIHRMYEATPEEIRRETRQLIEAVFDDGRGLIVCPTASPYIRGAGERCFPQYKAMIDTVLEYG